MAPANDQLFEMIRSDLQSLKVSSKDDRELADKRHRELVKLFETVKADGAACADEMRKHQAAHSPGEGFKLAVANMPSTVKHFRGWVIVFIVGVACYVSPAIAEIVKKKAPAFALKVFGP